MFQLYFYLSIWYNIPYNIRHLISQSLPNISHLHSEIQDSFHKSHQQHDIQDNEHRRWLMGDIIKSVAECDSVYGMVLVLACLVFFFITIHYALPLLCDFGITTIRAICNTIKTFNSFHAKVEVDDVSVETDLSRQFWAIRFPRLVVLLLFVPQQGQKTPHISHLFPCAINRRVAVSLFWFYPVTHI